MKDIKENQYFRVKYRKLSTSVKLSSNLRCDIKFEEDLDNKYVFSLYPFFENLSDNKIQNHYEALDEGAAIIRKPVHDDVDGYYDLIRSRVKVGAKAYFVGGSEQIAELEVIELLGEI